MTVQKIAWRSFLPNFCVSDQNPSPKPKKPAVSKQASFQRLSPSDLSSSTLSEDLSISLAGSDLHVFTVGELKVITQSFSSSNFLGEGGFGPVHKGFIDDKLRPGLKAQPVAVKLLDLEGMQGHREWLTEVIFLGQLRHPHLVKLIGYCCEDEHRLLVYEYMPRGSLENQLFRRYTVSLPWSARMKIALGAAKGLAFLHEAEKPTTLPNSRILDSRKTDQRERDARFYESHGHARLCCSRIHHDRSPDSSKDVYSFGVVLLELITGRRPQLKDPRKLRRILDPRLEGQYSEMGAEKAAQLAYQCISYRPKLRPTISSVVKTLEPLQDFDDIPSGPFVYTVPADLQKENVKDESRGQRETKKDRESDGHRNRRGHRNHRTRSPKSQTMYSESTALKQNLRNGLNSPVTPEN
ncbi:hypothetical protein C3L33_19249, partial [Rhododendron williamsianum]